MSHYLITKLRLASNGRITDVAIHKLAPDPSGVVGWGVGPEQLMPSTRVADCIAHGDIVYVGSQDTGSGAYRIGDEVRPARNREDLESCNIDGARTKSLRALPRLP